MRQLRQARGRSQRPDVQAVRPVQECVVLLQAVPEEALENRAQVGVQAAPFEDEVVDGLLHLGTGQLVKRPTELCTPRLPVTFATALAY